MAADNAKRLISKIIRERHLDLPLSRGVSQDWFANPEDKAVFGFLVKHYEKYGEVPSPVTVKDNYPTYRLLAVNDALEYLVDQMAAYRRAVAAHRIVHEAADFMDNPNDYEKVIDTLRSGLASLDEAVSTSSDYDLVGTAHERFAEYEARKGNPSGLLGLPTGFPTIDRATAGLQPQQLVTIIASPKSGKSQAALRIATHIHDQGYTPMFQSFEMSNFEQRERFDAMYAGLSHSRLQRGLLTADEEAHYRDRLKELAKASNRFILTDSSAGTTVSALGAKISQHQPDIAFVDGVYLMTDEITGEKNTPQALTNITRAFKQLAQRLNIPIILTTQTLLWKMKKTRVSEDAIGYSSSFLQDSDVILGLERIDSEDPADQLRRILRVVASRNCGPASVECDWDWSTSTFAEIEGTGESEEDYDSGEYEVA